MLTILIPLLIIASLLYFNMKKKRSIFSPSSLILLLYLFSLLAAYPYILIFDQQQILQYEFLESSLIFCLLFLLFILPISSFREDQIKIITLPDKKVLFYFSSSVCILSLFSIGYFFPTLIQVITTPDIGAARIAIVKSDEILVSRTIFNTIAGTAASFYQIPLMLFFIYEITKKHTILKWLLFISSFSYIFFVTTAYGRDGFLFWIISFIGTAGLFMKFITRKTKKVLIIIGASFLIFGSVGFMIISFSRFGDQTANSIISYIGQSFPNYCLLYEANVPHSSGASFPLFRAILGLPEYVDTELQAYKLYLAGTYSYVFTTFIGSFMFSLGLTGTIILGIFTFIFIKYSLKSRGTFSFSQVLIYLLFFQIFYQGVFYFRQYNRVGNLVIITYFLLYLVFKIIMYGKKQVIRIQ